MQRVVDKTEAWIKRIEEVLAQPQRAGELVQTATSVLTNLYGPHSTQLKAFNAGLEMVTNKAGSTTSVHHAQLNYAVGTLLNARAELKAGLVPSVRVLVAGEVLGELVRLGKEILEEKSEGAKNVAAVLVAAAFEDLMRRIGEEFASVTGRPKLEEVIKALKDADVLKGGQVGTALSYLKFRNDSLHADWEKVDRSQVQSCIAFIEELLMKHFS